MKLSPVRAALREDESQQFIAVDDARTKIADVAWEPASPTAAACR